MLMKVPVESLQSEIKKIGQGIKLSHNGRKDFENLAAQYSYPLDFYQSKIEKKMANDLFDQLEFIEEEEPEET